MLSDDDVLFALAMARNTRVKNWYGRSGSSIRRSYYCHVCNALIDTESAKYPMTVHARKAIEAHKAYHLSRLSKEDFLFCSECNLAYRAADFASHDRQTAWAAAKHHLEILGAVAFYPKEKLLRLSKRAFLVVTPEERPRAVWLAKNIVKKLRSEPPNRVRAFVKRVLEDQEAFELTSALAQSLGLSDIVVSERSLEVFLEQMIALLGIEV